MSIFSNAAGEATKPSGNTQDLSALQLWVHVVVAALAMVATFPGRTLGLGFITEPLLKDLALDRVDFATMNLWATLLGALFCLPCGWLIDRLGTRIVLTGVTLSLGAVVVLMSRVQATETTAFTVPMPSCLGGGVVPLTPLSLGILLTRGLGQSALSVVSLALVGRSAGRQGSFAFGVYSFVVALGFTAAIGAVRMALSNWQTDWRSLWSGIGFSVGVFGVLAFLLVRSTAALTSHPGESSGTHADSFTLGQALRSPTFWVFAAGTSLYGAIQAGLHLFNQSILKERDFSRDVFLDLATIGPLIGLTSNLLTGWLATRIPLQRLLSVALLLLATALVLFPFVTRLAEVYLYAMLMAAVGGMITVLFFAVWIQAFGPAHLGKIQGAAQMLTVLTSAVGPLLLASSKQHYDSYLPLFYVFAATSAVVGIAALFTTVRPRTA